MGALQQAITSYGGASSPLLTDLVAYWKLDEASGTRVDATGRGNDLAVTISVDSAVGKIGNAADFERTVQGYLSRADNADLSTGDIDWTFSFWANLESLPGGGETLVLVGKDDWAGFTDRGYLLYIQNDAKFKWEVFGAGGASVGAVTANTFGAVSTATWYHVICWHDAVNNQVGITVNNGTPDTQATTGAAADNGSAFTLGGVVASADPSYDGLLDEVGLWKRMLTAGNRTALHNGGTGITHPF